MPLQFLLRLFSGQRNEEVFPEPSPEKKTDPQTPPPPPPPSRQVDLPTQPDSSHPLHDISAPDERDFKRVGKMTYNWAPVLLTVSVTLLVTTPHPVDHPDRVFLYAASTSLACLSLITAVGLIYYSILSHPGAKLAKVQEMVMGLSAVILVLAVLSRLALFIPFLLFLTIIASMILFAGLLFLPIYVAHKIKVT